MDKRHSRYISNAFNSNYDLRKARSRATRTCINFLLLDRVPCSPIIDTSDTYINFLLLDRVTFYPIIVTKANAKKFLRLEPVTFSSIIDTSAINKLLAARPGNFLRVLASWVLNFLQVLASQVLNFLRLLAPKILTSCVSNVLVGKPQKHGIFASCESLRILAAQELLAPLLARALFLGCTVISKEGSMGETRTE